MKKTIIYLNIFTILFAIGAIYTPQYLQALPQHVEKHELIKERFKSSQDIEHLRRLGILYIELQQTTEKVITKGTKVYKNIVALFIPLSILNIVLAMGSKKKPNKKIKPDE
jgi:hypothetical protein